MKRILFLLLALPLALNAQVLNPKKLPKARQSAWEAYVKQLHEDLPAFPETLPALADSAHASLQLPVRLEHDMQGNPVYMNYWYGTTGEAPTAEQPSPVFLYLHGSGPRDLEWLTGIHLCLNFPVGNAIWVIPQIPQAGEWYRWYQKSKQWAYERLFRELLARPDVDPARILLFGISEGGYGSQRLASFYADYLAGAGPMAGGEPLKNAPAENVRHIAFSLRTGAKDTGFYRNYLTGITKQALDSLQRLYPTDFRHVVELIPERGHHIDYAPTPVYLSHMRRNVLPKQFTWEDYEMDGRHRSGFYYLAVDKRPCDSLRTRYDVSVSRSDAEGAVVHVSVENVHYRTTEVDPHYGIELTFQRSYEPATGGRFTLFFNEDMIDFLKPVTVFVNGRQVFQGRLRMEKKHIVRSLELWGDPLRMMPGAVTLDY